MITVGSRWRTGLWRSEPREIVIEPVPEGFDEVRFRFLDNDKHSACTTSAFLRTYIEAP